MKDLWYFHIPKTAGRALKENVFDVLENDLYGYANLKYNDHNSFSQLDNNNSCSISIIRNPVERTISHWLYFYKNARRINPELEKKEMIDYLINHPESCLINYQSKFISTEINNYGIEKDIFGYTPDMNLVKKRINSITYLLDSQNQNNELYQKLLDDIKLNFGVLDNKKQLFKNTYKYKNKHSQDVFNSLNIKEVKLLEEIMHLDMEVYCSSSFFVI